MSPTEIDLRRAAIRLMQEIADDKDLPRRTIYAINELLAAVNASQDLEDAEWKAKEFKKVKP
jgi:hypothetical protein